jgi:hypothetical protein
MGTLQTGETIHRAAFRHHAAPPGGDVLFGRLREELLGWGKDTPLPPLALASSPASSPDTPRPGPLLLR